MKSTWELKENSQGELLVTVEGQAWLDAQEKALDKIAKDVEIDGFRKGTAPKSIVKKRIKEESILMEALDACAQDALTAGLEEHKLTPVARAGLDVQEITPEKVVYKFNVTVSPEVKLGAYKDLGIEIEEVTVTDEEVDAALTKLADDYAELEVIEDRPAQLNDTVVIDFEGFDNGVAFEGGKGENYSLQLGSNSFIPGFEEQVVGMKTGEEKDLTVTFPEDYHAEALAGKEVIFKVKVNEIKERVIPELNDDFAKEVNREGVETLEDLKNNIREQLLHDKKHQAEDEANNQLFDKVIENSEVDIPQIMIDEETERMLDDFKNRLAQQGFPYEQFIQMTGQTEQQLKEEMSKDAEKKVKLRLILEAIVEAEGFDVVEDEIEAEYKAIAEMYQMEVEKVKELISDATLIQDIKVRKAYDLIKIS